MYWHTKFCILHLAFRNPFCLRFINENKSAFHWHNHYYTLYFEIGHRSDHLTHLILRDEKWVWSNANLEGASWSTPKIKHSSYLSLSVILVSLFSFLFDTLIFAYFKNRSLYYMRSENIKTWLLMTVWKKKI